MIHLNPIFVDCLNIIIITTQYFLGMCESRWGEAFLNVIGWDLKNKHLKLTLGTYSIVVTEMELVTFRA